MTMIKPDSTSEYISSLANSLYQKGICDASHTVSETEIIDEELNAENNKSDLIPEELNSSGDTAKYNAPTIMKVNDTNQYYYFLSYDKPMTTSNNFERPYYHNMDIHSIRNDFPILKKKINGKPLIWLDNGATTQKPNNVINALNTYYHEYNSNIHRGAHTLAQLSTDAYESARQKVQNFIGAASTDEIIFVRGTTEAINLVAQTYGRQNILKGDEILITAMEHHSNIVPWQILQKETGAIIKVIPMNERGEIDLQEYVKLLSPRTKMVAIAHVSNVLGTINPISTMSKMAHDHGACVLVDGAQAIPHFRVDVKELNADFYAFSGHKMYAPTGIGVLYGKKALLEEMPPWQRGGGMIRNVTFDETTYNNLPYKFEAGTGNIADAIGLGAAIDYMQKIGMDKIEYHEKELTSYTMNELSNIKGLHIIGTAQNKISVISFVINGIIPEVAARYLNQEGLALRVGHHCAQPTLQRYHVSSAVRASLGLYNTKQDIDTLVRALQQIVKHYR